MGRGEETIDVDYSNQCIKKVQQNGPCYKTMLKMVQEREKETNFGAGKEESIPHVN